MEFRYSYFLSEKFLLMSNLCQSVKNMANKAIKREIIRLDLLKTIK